MLVFVGDFDGVSFTADRWQWLDHGPDYYAGVTFSGMDERVMIAWLNNWSYAHDLPEAPWRGSMALPRTIGVRDGRVVQTPAVAPQELPLFHATDVELSATGWILPSSALATASRLRLRIDAESGHVSVRWESAEVGTIVELTHTGSELLLVRHGVAIDRSDAAFPSSARTALPANTAGSYDLDVWVDANSIEVFAADGAVTLSLLTLADYGRGLVTLTGGGARLERVLISELVADV
jgi:sucrose-6-phosphate hydrolase SacC (GH32 family)